MIRCGNALASWGLRPGDAVQISLYNNSDFFIPVLGAWMAGAVTSMSDPSLSPEVMRQQMVAVRPKSGSLH